MEIVKKLEEQGNITNQLFEGLFDKKIIKRTGDNSYILNGNIINMVYGNTRANFMDYDWINGKLNWLTNSNFYCEGLNIDFNTEKLINFEGVWYNGNFHGGNFMVGSKHPNDGFLNGLFWGNYKSSYGTYKAGPESFVDGTFLNWREGNIFGEKNIDTVLLRKGVLSYLKISVDSDIQITDKKNNKYFFRLDKTIDSINSDIKIRLLGNEEKILTQKWKDIRLNIDSTFIKIGNRFSIEDLFQTEYEVVEIMVKHGIEIPKQNSKEIELVDDYLDLSKIPAIGVKDIKGVKPIVKMQFPTGHRDIYLKFVDRIKNGEFISDLILIKRGLELCFISGYYDNIYLKNMFLGIKGEKPEKEEYEQALKRLDDFVGFVILNIVKRKSEKGVFPAYKEIRDKIYNNIALFLEIDKNLNSCGYTTIEKKEEKPNIKGKIKV